MKWSDALKLSDICLDAAEQASETELKSLIEDAKGVGSGESLATFETKMRPKVEEMGFDFITIILALLPMILECFQPKGLRARGQRVRVALAIMREERRQ